MKTATHTHFIYETDNIPEHRSRRFGCCPCLMAVREFAAPQQKAASEGQLRRGKRKTNQQLNKSVLPFHHTTPAWATQAGKGSSR